MIAVDTRLLVYAHRAEAKHHPAAAQVLAELAEGRGAWALPSQVLHEFLGIVTHPRIYDPPSTPVRRGGRSTRGSTRRRSSC